MGPSRSRAPEDSDGRPSATDVIACWSGCAAGITRSQPHLAYIMSHSSGLVKRNAERTRRKFQTKPLRQQRRSGSKVYEHLTTTRTSEFPNRGRYAAQFERKYPSQQEADPKSYLFLITHCVIKLVGAVGSAAPFECPSFFSLGGAGFETRTRELQGRFSRWDEGGAGCRATRWRKPRTRLKATSLRALFAECGSSLVGQPEAGI
jgi:hypothetical protein